MLKKDERGGPAQSTERHLQKFRAQGVIVFAALGLD